MFLKKIYNLQFWSVTRHGNILCSFTFLHFLMPKFIDGKFNNLLLHSHDVKGLKRDNSPKIETWEMVILWPYDQPQAPKWLDPFLSHDAPLQRHSSNPFWLLNPLYSNPQTSYTLYSLNSKINQSHHHISFTLGSSYTNSGFTRFGHSVRSDY